MDQLRYITNLEKKSKDQEADLMQSRRQIQDLQKKQKKSKKSDKKETSGQLSKKKLKEEIVPHKLKIKKMFSKTNTTAAEGDHDEEPGSNNSGQSKLDDSNGSNQDKKRRKPLDVEISKGDIKMRAALNSYLSVSESDEEETKQPKQSMKIIKKA